MGFFPSLACARLLLIALAFSLSACETQPTQTHPISSPPASPSANAAAPGATTENWVHTQWWESGVGGAALITDANGRPICNGVMVGRRFAVSVGACLGTGLIRYRPDHSPAPIPAQRTPAGPIAIYELGSEWDAWTFEAPVLLVTPPPSAEDVRAIVFAYPDLVAPHESVQPCHIQADGHGGLRSICQSANNLPGAPIFNWNGQIVGLMSDNGAVIAAAAIREILHAHGVRRSPTDEL